MALIYRAIFEVEDSEGGFVDRALAHVRDWLRYKLADPDLDFDSDASEARDIRGIEVSDRVGRSAHCVVRRISAYEGTRDDGTQVKTTLTAIRGEDLSWAWVDLERWTGDHRSPTWLPVAPGLVSTLLTSERARRGKLPLASGHVVVARGDAPTLAEHVLDLSRELPLVVVSYNREEGVPAAATRARELARRLAGVAGVYLLGEGAVSEFSRAMYEAVGEGMDVYSGAIRTYLPGAGSGDDFPARHRFVAFHRLDGRRPDLATYLIAPALLRRAVEMPPPALWRASARALLEETTDYAELLRISEDESDALRDRVTALEERLDEEREDNTQLQRRVDDLTRQVRFLRTELRRLAPEVAEAEPEPDDFEPVLCSEVVDAARERLGYVEVHPSVSEGAEALDAHGDITWARRAWSALLALNRYAEMKAEGSFNEGFLQYCEKASGEAVIPTSWVVPTETAATIANRRFRELRMLPVSTDVDPTGRILMEAHVRIEKGGRPSPRIHYYDDTRGSTGMVHIGWFGDHLDSWAKS